MNGGDVYYYGVWPGGSSGHFLHDTRGQTNPERTVGRELREHGDSRWLYPWPCGYAEGARRYARIAKSEGKLWSWRAGPFTLLGCWDSSGDPRARCCSTFVARAHLPPDELLSRAREAFPDVFARIEGRLGDALELAGAAPGT